MRKGGGSVLYCVAPCFRVVVRVSVLSHVPRAIMHTSVVVCVGRLSCWGGEIAAAGEGGEGGEGFLSLHFLAFSADPTPLSLPRARPSPPLLMLTSRVLFRPRPLRCVCVVLRVMCV